MADPKEQVVNQLIKARAAFHAFVNGHPGTYKEPLVGVCSLALDEAIDIVGHKIDEMEAFKTQRKKRIADRAWALFCEGAAGWNDEPAIAAHMEACIKTATHFEKMEIA